MDSGGQTIDELLVGHVSQRVRLSEVEMQGPTAGSSNVVAELLKCNVVIGPIVCDGDAGNTGQCVPNTIEVAEVSELEAAVLRKVPTIPTDECNGGDSE